MGLFGAPRCDKCGCKMVIMKTDFQIGWGCPNCLEKIRQEKRIKQLEEEIRKLKINKHGKSNS